MARARRDQILAILQQSEVALDDDEIASLAQMNRVYVNALCRQLADEGLISRRRGTGSKLVNSPAGAPATANGDLAVPVRSAAPTGPTPRT